MTRKSVPTEGVHRYWECGWLYIMPDFDNRAHSIIEWAGGGTPVEPIQSTTEHSALGVRSIQSDTEQAVIGLRSPTMGES